MEKKIRDLNLIKLRNVILEDIGRNYAHDAISFYESLIKIHPNLDMFLRDVVDSTIDVFIDFQKNELEKKKFELISTLLIKKG